VLAFLFSKSFIFRLRWREEIVFNRGDASFDGFNDRKELDYYYPTSVLVTGWDIIFLWVARMVMAGYEWESKRPFEHVYFTGMVRDKLRRKMSKSLGNSPDALKLIEDFGADGVRFGMMSCSPAGGDLLFDEKLCEQGRNFSNKLWNALRLVDGWTTDTSLAESASDALAYSWMKHKLTMLAGEIDRNFSEYRLSEALMSIYSFVWDDFCSWYLEMVKPAYGEAMAPKTKENTVALLSEICSLLHPFMPFITEEIWHVIQERKEGDDCILSKYPKSESFDGEMINKIEQLKEIVSGIRDIRNKNGLKMKDEIQASLLQSERAAGLIHTAGWKDICCKLATLQDFNLTTDEQTAGVAFISGTEKCFVLIESDVNVADQLEEKQKELAYQQGFVSSVRAKLENERFVSGAPQAVVEKEKAKLADGLERIKLLEEDIARLTRMAN
jgi:valyl-tRNA synthetase